MEKSKIINKNKILLLVYLCIAWFLPYVYSFISSKQSDKYKQAVVIIIFIASTVLYNVFKNRFANLAVLISSIVFITVLINYRYTLSAFPSLAVLYAYSSLSLEDHNSTKIGEAILILSVFVAIAGAFLNISAILNITAAEVVLIVVLMIIFLILSKYAHGSKIDKKAKKSNKDKEYADSIDNLYKTIFSVSIIGVLSSAVTYLMNEALIFFPWFLFIALLIYKEDDALFSASEAIVSKIKAFTE